MTALALPADPAVGRRRTPGDQYRTDHHVRVACDPQTVYSLVRDVSIWPVLFGPTVAVETLDWREGDDGTITERFRIHAMVGGEVRQWTSRRRLDPARLTVDFEHEQPVPPLASMGGGWRFRPDGGGTEVSLAHRFSPADDSCDSLEGILEWVLGVLETNSRDELESLRRATGGPFPVDDLFVFCEDSVTVDSRTLPGGRLQAAFEFVDRADRWPTLLPHVEKAELTVAGAGVQELAMVTRTADGATHQTRSVRLVTSPERIVWKQLRPPAGLMGHAGEWEFRPSADGRELKATSRQLVMLDPAALDAGCDIHQTRCRWAEALSANSWTTLNHAVGRAKVAGGLKERRASR